MEYKLKSQADAVADTYLSIFTSESEEKLHYLLNVLECLDKRAALELERIDQSRAEEDLKDFIKQDILSRHQAKRLPFVTAAEELRAQYRASFANDERVQPT